MKDRNNLTDYLQVEYSNIAQAHFKTIETISTFFRNYLVIVSIPISLIVLFASISPKSEILQVIVSAKVPVSMILLAVSLIGMGVLFYIINLRMDAILYARTINGIRKYFYDSERIDINIKLRTRVLPQSPNQPAYHEKAYFWPVVLSFAIFDSLYFLFTLVGFTSEVKFEQFANISPPYWIWLPFILFFTGHFFGYWLYARYRERAYLRSHIIGIDIDGVLTSHRKHFCDLLSKNTGKVLDPNKITTIPVHECPGLNVSREDEKTVFNDPDYWVCMPIESEVAANLEKIKNVFKMKVFIFSYRPWPNLERMDKNKRKQLLIDWDTALLNFSGRVRSNDLFIIIIKWIKRLKHTQINYLTKLWLQDKGLKYDKLFIEKGNEDIADPRGHVNNRFVKSRENRIRYFVEDDLEKAIKLAYICDVVFLFNQPYNQNLPDLPSNIIRVESWDEIYRQIRKLS